ncbi:MAG: hypothetical protein ACL7BU_12160 [Candidatus Phlomobacter fragariae]
MLKDANSGRWKLNLQIIEGIGSKRQLTNTSEQALMVQKETILSSQRVSA